MAGFRIDAAKHMAPADVNILDKAGSPGAYLEVIGAGGESPDIQPGPLHLYRHTSPTSNTAPISPPTSSGRIKNLKTLGESWGLLPPTRPSSSWSTTTANAATAVAAYSPS